MADLAALLDKEASAEIEAIHSEAQERASEIVADAEEDAEELVSNRERAAKQQREAALIRARSSAELEAASMRLKAQQAAIESVFDEVKARLEKLVADEKRYAPILTTLAKQAVDAFGGSRGLTVVVHPDEKKVAEKVLKDLDVEAELETSEAVRGGVRVKGPKGSASIDNTLFEHLDSMRDELASEVSEVLLKKEA